MISSLEPSNLFIRLYLSSFSYTSVVLGYLGLAVVQYLSSEGVIVPWLLLVVFFQGPLAIWMALVPGYSSCSRYWEGV